MIVFLDFDGVIVDSIQECYMVSKETYYGHARFPYPEEECRELFYKYRGLVRPAYEYRTLHRAIELCMLEKTKHVDDVFKELILKEVGKDEEFFEKEFFYIRSLYRDTNFNSWVPINPLTDFGRTLVNKNNQDTYIVTTKNREATESLLDYYKINVTGIYANDEIKLAGTKGKLINAVMDDKAEVSAVFVDDAVEHLDTVNDNRVECYFADWGYGHNSKYPLYRWEDDKK
jgi:phosphoglycolate phosphatase-like HAD superfamily hydrolase